MTNKKQKLVWYWSSIYSAIFATFCACSCVYVTLTAKSIFAAILGLCSFAIAVYDVIKIIERRHYVE